MDIRQRNDILSMLMIWVGIIMTMYEWLNNMSKHEQLCKCIKCIYRCTICIYFCVFLSVIVMLFSMLFIHLMLLSRVVDTKMNWWPRSITGCHDPNHQFAAYTRNKSAESNKLRSPYHACDKRCSNYIWVKTSLLPTKMAYFRGLTVPSHSHRSFFHFCHPGVAVS